jgi:hypothetical protein
MADDQKRKPRPQGWKQSPPVKLPGTRTSDRVDLEPAKFKKLIESKGTRVRVFRTTFCPNVKSIDGGEHQIDCDICGNNGWLDVRPIETIAFIQNQNFEKMIFSEGLFDGNSVAATFDFDISLQYFTLVELVDFPEIFYQRVKRQKGNLDILKYRAHSVNLLIDQNGKEYFPDNDFVLDLNGSVRWNPNKGPDPGCIYTIHYNGSIQFRAVRAMHVNRFTQVFSPENGGTIEHLKLPEQWLLQKEFLVKRKDKDGNEILPNLIQGGTDPDEPTDPYQEN